MRPAAVDEHLIELRQVLGRVIVNVKTSLHRYRMRAVEVAVGQVPNDNLIVLCLADHQDRGRVGGHSNRSWSQISKRQARGAARGWHGSVKLGVGGESWQHAGGAGHVR